jgi:hypothetical protein
MDIPYFLQATSGAVESPSQTKITPNQHEKYTGKDYEAPRGQPQNVSMQAHILVRTAADLVALTSRLQTASIEAVYLFFLCSFQADTRGKDV